MIDEHFFDLHFSERFRSSLYIEGYQYQYMEQMIFNQQSSAESRDGSRASWRYCSLAILSVPILLFDCLLLKGEERERRVSSSRTAEEIITENTNKKREKPK
ncbi:hypothetical protein SAY87_029938 [Trapa incisa]|uniref:Uncharacterized protein n=1 Tax=Trapa incisa TaxID=236973 RepID=A0AAN7K8I7_9MYRT|nr:hypothetical protein SAY87_029938 [Trapa incisa]